MFSAHLQTRPVLIAHHEAAVALGVQCMLLRAGYPADVTVLDGSGATQIGEFDAHLVIVDLDTAIRIARRRGSAVASLKRVVVSVHAAKADCQAALDAGADGLLLTAFTAHELIDAMEVVLRGSRYRSPRAEVLLAEADDALTLRELEVTQYLVGGYAYKEIARELGIAMSTVKAHAKSIYAKLNASNRVHASCIAAERGIVPRRRAPSLDSPTSTALGSSPALPRQRRDVFAQAVV